MKISIGRSGKEMGEYNWEDVKTGLKEGIFLSSDYGWYSGMTEWQPLVQVLRNLEFLNEDKPSEPDVAPPDQKDWMDDEPTRRQIRFLERCGITIPAGLTKGVASSMISKLPEPYLKLTRREISKLKRHNIDVEKTSLAKCQKLLKTLR